MSQTPGSSRHSPSQKPGGSRSTSRQASGSRASSAFRPSTSSRSSGPPAPAAGRYWRQDVTGISPVYVHRPKAIVFDLLGTASKSGFLERILFPYLRLNMEPYIETHWSKEEFQALFQRIREQSLEMNPTGEPTGSPMVTPYESSEARPSLINFINYITESGIPSAPITQLRFKIWFEGYQSARLRTPIYQDVPDRVRQWFVEGIKFFVFSNTWVEAQRALLRNTNHGDLTGLIAGHFDNDFGSLTSSDSFVRLCQQIGLNPNDVLFLTKSAEEARAAQTAGLYVVLVLTHRHNVRAVSHEDRQRFPFVRTLNDLLWLESAGAPASSAVAGPPAGATGSQATG